MHKQAEFLTVTYYGGYNLATLGARMHIVGVTQDQAAPVLLPYTRCKMGLMSHGGPALLVDVDFRQAIHKIKMMLPREWVDEMLLT